MATVLVREGDKVKEDEPVVQIETDKVTVDIKAPGAGTISSVLVSFHDALVAEVIVIL